VGASCGPASEHSLPRGLDEKRLTRESNRLRRATATRGEIMLQLINLVMFATFLGSPVSSDAAVAADVAITCDDDVTSSPVSTDETTDLLDDNCEAECMELLGWAKVMCIKACRV
jgi:hypothetical protein